MRSINPVFGNAAHVLRPSKPVPFDKAYDELLQKIKTSLSRQSDINKLEPEFQKHFKNFLHSAGYELAAKNFDQLLKEMSGPYAVRSDGSVGWYHQFIPLMGVLSLVRKGHHHGGISIRSLEKHGGLEVLICTHLRHDSVEDHITPEELEKQQRAMLAQIALDGSSYDVDKGAERIDHIMINTDLMTQKKRWDPREKTFTKEDVKDYMERMLYIDYANPVVFILKQADVIHNFATLFAPKFPAERRMKRCNEREDMYGPRYGFTDIAMAKWPDFKGAITALDCLMGFQIYPHFRYLENVDLAYPDKRPSDMPVGINRYVKKATSGFNLPEEIHMAHMSLKNMMNSVDLRQDPGRYARLVNFTHKTILPALHGHEDAFPYLFKARKNKTSYNVRIAMP